MSACSEQRIPIRLIELEGQQNIPDAYQHTLLLCRTDQHVVWRGQSLPKRLDPLLDLMRGTTVGLDVGMDGW